MVPQFYYNEPWWVFNLRDTILRDVTWERWLIVHPLRRYMPTKGGLRGAVDSLLVTIGIWREDQVPGPKFKPEGFRLEQCVRAFFFLFFFFLAGWSFARDAPG